MLFLMSQLKPADYLILILSGTIEKKEEEKVFERKMNRICRGKAGKTHDNNIFRQERST